MIYIELFHGHHTPDEELDEWGFQGPILGPFPFFHMTYGDDIKLGDGGLMIRGEHYAFPAPDKDGFIYFLGAYYGDMSISDGETILKSPDLIDRIRDTKKAFEITGNDFGMYINDPTEWIKHYAHCKLKGIL
jgi:hypothetical protein